MTGILTRRPREDTGTLRHTERRGACEDGDRVESHIYKPRNTKYSWQPPEGGREAREDSSLESSGWVELYQNHDWGLAASQTVKE